MKEGFYVVRMPARGSGGRLAIESRPQVSRQVCEGWRDFVQLEHPKDEVFIIEISKEEEE